MKGYDDDMGFNKLKELYICNPNEYGATAFWKMMDGTFTESDEYVMMTKGEVITYFEPKTDVLDLGKYLDYKVFVIHEKYSSSIMNKHHFKMNKYFKLVHSLENIDNKLAGFNINEVKLPVEIPKVVSVIKNCYENVHINDEIVKRWMMHPVFQNDLWIWIKDSNGEIMGLGIAEFDSNCNEGALEWIQVLPNHRGKGVGRALVNQLLLRLRNRANFVTVAGEVDNKSNPDILYRKCGFVGDSVWNVFTK